MSGDIISFFFQMLSSVNTECALLTEAFMNKILEKDTKQVQRIAKKNKLNEKKKILAAVNIKNSHWTLIYFDRERSEVSYLDSFRNPGSEYTSHFISYLCADNNALVENEIKVVDYPCLQQTDSYNCGILICVMADYLVHGGVVPNELFSAERLNMLRIKLSHKMILFYENKTHKKNVNNFESDVSGSDVSHSDVSYCGNVNTNVSSVSVNIGDNEQSEATNVSSVSVYIKDNEQSDEATDVSSVSVNIGDNEQSDVGWLVLTAPVETDQARYFLDIRK